jgi:pseudaminic acid cytidylyltransferase
MNGNVAIIPARGGSKRIPRKNVRPFHGKPIIRWVVDVAESCGCFDAVVVSTEDAEIAEIAREAGAMVPFNRPNSLSDDVTPTVSVMAHALGVLAEQGHSISRACCIYPTAVFASCDSILQGLSLLREGGCNYVMSVVPYSHPIERALRVTSANSVIMDAPQHVATRSQDLQPAFHDAGQFYWGISSAWLSNAPILSGSTKAVILRQSEAHDIDSEEDWKFAEQLFTLSSSRNTF